MSRPWGANLPAAASVVVLLPLAAQAVTTFWEAVVSVTVAATLFSGRGGGDAGGDAGCRPRPASS